jgi:hypothetical protein
MTYLFFDIFGICMLWGIQNQLRCVFASTFGSTTPSACCDRAPKIIQSGLTSIWNMDEADAALLTYLSLPLSLQGSKAGGSEARSALLASLNAKIVSHVADQRSKGFERTLARLLDRPQKCVENRCRCLECDSTVTRRGGGVWRGGKEIKTLKFVIC